MNKGNLQELFDSLPQYPYRKSVVMKEIEEAIQELIQLANEIDNLTNKK